MAVHLVEGAQQQLPGRRETNHLSPNSTMETLQQQLICTYMELNHIRSASKRQAKLSDAKLQQLQVMLDATRKERDEAFQECMRLHQYLLEFSNGHPPPFQCASANQHAAPIHSSTDKSSAQNLGKTSDVSAERLVCPFPNTQNSQSSITFQDDNPATSTLEQDKLGVFDSIISWEKCTSLENSDNTFLTDTSSAFNELNHFELPELQEDFVSEWQEGLTMAWDTVLSSPSHADSTPVSWHLSTANTQHSARVPNSSVTVSSIDRFSKRKACSIIEDICASGSPSPTVVKDGTPSSTSSNVMSLTSLSAHTPIMTMSEQVCTPPRTKRGFQSTSEHTFVSYELSTTTTASMCTPFMCMSEPASVCVSMGEHSPRSGVPSISPLASTASSSAYSAGRTGSLSPVPFELKAPSPSLLEPTPLTRTVPISNSQLSPVPLACQYTDRAKEALTHPFISSSHRKHAPACENCEFRPLFSTPSPSPSHHQFTSEPTRTSSKLHQMPLRMSPQKRRHLPEPPEANIDVILSSLPEKGKLLEAVVQAGLLLQQNLSPGLMQKWWYPPPQLNIAHISSLPLTPAYMPCLSTSENAVPSHLLQAQCLPSSFNGNQLQHPSTLM